jgi:hypothetical protein
MDAGHRRRPASDGAGDPLMPFADAAARRAYQRAYYRPRMKARYRRWRKFGGCGECGEPSGRFARCFKHRVRLAARKRETRRTR